MPTYHARGVEVRLGAMPLNDTITPTIILKKGDLAKKQCEDAEQKLLGNQLLPEERVSFPGDERDFGLHWLGGAPFMQAQAGKNLSVKESPTNVRRLHSATNGTDNTRRDLLSLSLHVTLSDRTFVSGLDDRNKLHLKIDVLFNGQLSSCLFLPYSDVRTGVKALDQKFSGFRVDFLAERPWVIVPPRAAVDGSPSKRKGSTSVEKRWNDICQALIRESDERGMDKHGNIPPSAEFLKALATMQMPAEVDSMQEPGSKEFGIIDVVISAGDGKKVTSGAGYLKAPQRLLDSNFPLRNRPQGSNEDRIASGDVETPSGAVREMSAFAAETSDMDAEGDNDSEYEPQPKRRVLAPCVLSVCSDSFSSPEHGRTAPNELPDHIEHDIFDSTAFGTPQSLNPFASSSFSFARTPQMRPSPYSFQFSDPILGQNTSSGLMSLPSFDNVPFLSSPLPQFPRNFHASYTKPLPRQAQPLEYDSGRYYTPVSVASAHILPINAAPTRLWPAPPTSSQRQGLFRPQAHIPNMLPPPTSSSHHNGTVFDNLQSASPYDRRFSMPLPPTGLFSVPTKPRSSLSPSKKARSESQTSQGGFLLKRLIVKGKDDTILVDNRWSIAQRIGGKNRLADPDHTVGSSACDNVVEPPGPQEVASPQRSITNSTPAGHPSSSHKSPFLSSVSNNQQIETSNNSNDNSTKSQHPVEVEAWCASKVDNTTTKASMAPLKNSTSSASNIKPTIPQRRITPNLNILGVQGSKATTFWLEDPEEIMREAARLRRSRSPIKRKNTSQSTKGATSRQVNNVLDPLATGSSSPLSSVPTTPEPEDKLQTTPNDPPILEATYSIPQVDGSSEQKTSSVSPQKLAPSPKKRALTSPQRRAPDSTFTPTKSLSASAKKRKTAPGRYMAKQPRSPDRLKTVSNPPLNQNCVIAFAESEDKDSAQGVLRQVRSERQGVFAEQYVVFATRLFVAGN
jgi:hypothetical protein